MTQEQLSGTIDRFFSFIQARGDGVDQAKTDLFGFFSSKKGSHIVHDQGVLYFYRDKKLLNAMDAKVSDSPMIHTFDGRKITSVSPYTDRGGFLMKSGGGKKRGTRRGSSSGGISSNNNNNNNNNNNG